MRNEVYDSDFEVANPPGRDQWTISPFLRAARWQPSFPWLAEYDMYGATGIPREDRARFVQMMSGCPGGDPARTIATADGIVRIVPHYAAQEFFDLFEKLGGLSLLRDYRRAGLAALKIITEGLPWDAVLECIKAEFSENRV